jgi:hypothetical protein
MPQIPSGFGQNRGILFFAADSAISGEGKRTTVEATEHGICSRLDKGRRDRSWREGNGQGRHTADGFRRTGSRRSQSVRGNREKSSRNRDVLPCRYQDGTPPVLKLSPLAQEAKEQVIALSAWAGCSTPRLLAESCDEHGGSLLIDRI